MSRKLCPFSGRQFLDANGDPYSGAKLFSYEAGSSTKVTLTKDQAGASNHTNPIILNTRGEPADGSGASKPMWQADGVAVKLVLAPSDDTDPPVSAISTWDELEGINDTAVSGGGDEWITGATPPYVSATSLTLVGDVTAVYHPGRRIKTTNSVGTIYSTIQTSVYATLTTLVVINDSGTLDSGLSVINYSLLSSTNRALPTGKGIDIASSSTITIGTDGRYFDITGTVAITAINSVSVGTVVKLQFDAALVLTHHATDLILPGGVSITTVAGDEAEFVEYASGDWRCTNYSKADGYAPVTNASLLELQTEADLTNGGADDLTVYDFTSIPAWVQRITVMFDAVSTSGTDPIVIQLGDAGGIETSGYLGTAGSLVTNTSNTAVYTSYFALMQSHAAARILHGAITFTLQDSANNTWVASGFLGGSDANHVHHTSGLKPLSAILTQLRITTTSGTDLFDGGSANVMYE